LVPAAGLGFVAVGVRVAGVDWALAVFCRFKRCKQEGAENRVRIGFMGFRGREVELCRYYHGMARARRAQMARAADGKQLALRGADGAWAFAGWSRARSCRVHRPSAVSLAQRAFYLWCSVAFRRRRLRCLRPRQQPRQRRRRGAHPRQRRRRHLRWPRPRAGGHADDVFADVAGTIGLYSRHCRRGLR